MALREMAVVLAAQHRLETTPSLHHPGELRSVTMLGWDKCQQVSHSLVRTKSDHILMQYLKKKKKHLNLIQKSTTNNTPKIELKSELVLLTFALGSNIAK